MVLLSMSWFPAKSIIKRNYHIIRSPITMNDIKVPNPAHAANPMIRCLKDRLGQNCAQAGSSANIGNFPPVILFKVPLISMARHQF